MTFEIYYNDGGHCGPYKSFMEAYKAAYARLNRITTRIEIRHTTSKTTGGYAPRNIGSYYVSK